MLAPWIIANLPPHRIYVEPFGGAASVLMRKPRAYAEVYNDLDGDVVNVFRVLRDAEAAGRLEALLRLTPFARDEFFAAYEESVDPPYLPETRTRNRGEYRHELSEADHRALLTALRGLHGKVVLSGYPASLYDDLLPGWRRVERPALADGARPRSEVLWLNPAASAEQGLFAERVA